MTFILSSEAKNVYFMSGESSIYYHISPAMGKHCSFHDHTHLNVFEKLEVLALDYTYHTQPGRIRLVMDISQIKAYLK